MDVVKKISQIVEQEINRKGYATLNYKKIQKLFGVSEKTSYTYLSKFLNSKGKKYEIFYLYAKGYIIKRKNI